MVVIRPNLKPHYIEKTNYTVYSAEKNKINVSAHYRCGSWLGGLVLETGGLVLAIDIDHSASRCISNAVASRGNESGLWEPT